MFAVLCRVVAVVGALALTSSASAQEPAGYDPTEPGAVVPPIAAPGWGDPPPEVVERWHMRSGLVASGAVTLVVGYGGAIAIALYYGLNAHDEGCVETYAGVHAIPVFGPIAGWTTLATCPFRRLHPWVAGLLDLPATIAQVVGFSLLMGGVTGRHDPVIVPRASTTTLGLELRGEF